MTPTDNCKICNNTTFQKLYDTRDYFLSGELFYIYQCNSCGFKFTYPIPSPDDIGRYYKSSDYVSHSDTNKGLFFKVYQFVKSLNIKNKYKLVCAYAGKGKILDYGCGTGDFLGLFKNKGWDCYGLEQDADTRAYASHKQGFEIGSPEDIEQLPAASFNAITLWHVLEHIHDINLKLEQFYKLLKPDGVLIIAVPNADSFDAQHYGKYWAAYDVPRHLYHFSQKTLSRLLLNHQFQIHTTKNMLFDSFYVSMLSEKYMKNKMPFFKGIFWGAISNFKILSKKYPSSSTIFIIRKKMQF
ncbi:MAG: Malonyl-(acyl-carrier protein) O-methyltransferase [Bacteroidetes bacterium ADurb.Bin408]|nr:MAG: Malonyl-(acyl-carrier protein) O-methyltransferase [Bacteroidetes bacterium ADurb.Bin408]